MSQSSSPSRNKSYARQQQQQPLLDPSQLDAQAAETAVLESIIDQQERQRRSRTNLTTGTAASDYQRRSVEDVFSSSSTQGETSQPRQTKRYQRRFQDIARRALMQQQQQRQRSLQARGHRRNMPSRAQEMLGAIQQGEGDHRHGDGLFRRVAPEQRGLLAHVMDDEEDDSIDYSTLNPADLPTEIRGETLPLRQNDSSPDYGSVPIVSNLLRLKRTNSRVHCRCSNPIRCVHVLGKCIWQSFLVWIGLPLFIAAWILYYYLGNPGLDFLPGEATVAWWCNFAGRQAVTLDLAQLVQWIVLDGLVLGTRVSVRVLGPFLTLTAIQSKGWPFDLSAWAIWDLLILHGDNRFQVHWFYWTGWKIYSQANSGAYILKSHSYLRMLLAMLLAGVATALKRVFVAIWFGRRQFATFKPRLERILAEIILLNEVAALANSISDLDDERKKPVLKQPKGLAEVTWSSAKHVLGNLSDDEEAEPSINKEVKGEPARQHGLSVNVLNQLDRWEEPTTKSDLQVSINDVLKFKRALTFMDDDFPLGEDFGPAGNRNECLLSAQAIFYKLLKLTSDEDQEDLPFEILELLAVNGEGELDAIKRKAIRKLFRPGKGNVLTFLAFAQTCDAIYKRLCYFRASVENASVIDNVLEDFLNVIFFFILALLLLSLLQYNPWALLVPITSLLVSFSFAMGSSVSKYLEGALLIVVRRPYDLGDRIYIGDANIVMDGDASNRTFFVEGINITATTLRYARTNEVCTVSNFSIAGCRIINCNRSPMALIFCEHKTHISILEGDKLDKLRQSLETYVADRPRLWESIAFLRHDIIDVDNEVVTFSIAFRHCQSWQDAARIKLHRADLMRHIYEVTEKLGVSLDTPPARRILYEGGILREGNVTTYKKNLIQARNIQTSASARFKTDKGFTDDELLPVLPGE